MTSDGRVPMHVDERLLAVLRAGGFVAPGTTRGVEPLPGGVSSDVFRLQTPNGPVCVKRALPTLRVAVVMPPRPEPTSRPRTGCRSGPVCVIRYDGSRTLAQRNLCRALGLARLDVAHQRVVVSIGVIVFGVAGVLLAGSRVYPGKTVVFLLALVQESQTIVNIPHLLQAFVCPSAPL